MVVWVAHRYKFQCGLWDLRIDCPRCRRREAFMSGLTDCRHKGDGTAQVTPYHPCEGCGLADDLLLSLPDKCALDARGAELDQRYTVAG